MATKAQEQFNIDDVREQIAALESERDQLQGQLKKIDQKLQDLRDKYRAAALAYAEALKRDALKEFGISDSEMKKKSRKPLAIKYRNPEEPHQEWSGVGANEPDWIAPYRLNPGEKPRRYGDKVHIENQPT